MTDDGLIDLDALRAERASKAKPPPRLKIGGQVVVLPSEVPFAVLDYASGTKRGDVSDMTNMFKAIFGDAYDFILSQNLSLDDVRSIVQAIFKAYDLGPDALGEDTASTLPSVSTTTN